MDRSLYGRGNDITSDSVILDESHIVKSVWRWAGQLPLSVKDVKKSLAFLMEPSRAVWITEGYHKYINRFDDQVDEMKQKFIEEGNYANANRIYNVPDSLSGICKAHSAALFRAKVDSPAD